jgi:hypothetical protein
MTVSLHPTCVDALRVLGDDTASPAARAAQRHVDRCPACSALVDDADAADAVLASLAGHRPSRSVRLRAVLGVISVLQCLIALPWLFGENPLRFLESSSVASAHLTRDGAIGMIVGVAGLTTALRTRHAVAMVVTAGAAVGMQLLSFAIDQSNEHVHPLFETSHLLTPVVLVLIAIVGTRRAHPVGAPARGRRHLRAL